jgi:hypothetical protein
MYSPFNIAPELGVDPNVLAWARESTGRNFSQERARFSDDAILEL